MRRDPYDDRHFWELAAAVSLMSRKTPAAAAADADALIELRNLRWPEDEPERPDASDFVPNIKVQG